MFDPDLIWEGLLNLLFPEPVGCHICGAPGDLICPGCRSALYKNGPAQCSVCGRTISQGTVCEVCEEMDFTSLCRGIQILYRYDGTAREAVHQAKFSSSRKAARAIASLMAEAILAMPDKPDCILYVPSHPLRTALRGYSAMGYIARRIGKITGIPVEAQALQRVRYAAPLYRAGYTQRRSLVRGAFAKGKSKKAWQNAVLIDDVCTSGATVRECLRVLAAPERVQVLIFAGHEDQPLEESKDL